MAEAASSRQQAQGRLSALPWDQPPGTGLRRGRRAEASLPLRFGHALRNEEDVTQRETTICFFPPRAAFKSSSRNTKKRRCWAVGRDRIEVLFCSHSSILPLPFTRAPSSTLFLLRKFIPRLQGVRNEKPLFGVVFSCEFPTLG